MTGPITVPASVLAALGGLTEDDPPVVAIHLVIGRHAWHSCVPSTGPGVRVTDRLLLPASAPALLRVLARYLGMTLQPGEVPSWGCTTGMDWAIETRELRSHMWPARSAFAVAGEDADPMAALAAVLIHVAEGDR